MPQSAINREVLVRQQSAQFFVMHQLGEELARRVSFDESISPLLAHRDMLHCGGRPSLTEGIAAFCLAGRDRQRGNDRSAPSKRACSGPGSARSSQCGSAGRRLFILIAAPFSSRLSCYTAQIVLIVAARLSWIVLRATPERTFDSRALAPSWCSRNIYHDARMVSSLFGQHQVLAFPRIEGT